MPCCGGAPGGGGWRRASAPRLPRKYMAKNISALQQKIIFMAGKLFSGSRVSGSQDFAARQHNSQVRGRGLTRLWYYGCVGAKRTTYRGAVCLRHRELDGLRRAANSHCVGCDRERSRARRHDPKHAAKVRANDAGRRARKQVATPRLTPAEHLRIRMLYAEAARRTAETSIVHHVDHDTPLALGGLHHPDNLIVVSASLNLAKGARYRSTWDFISS